MLIIPGGGDRRPEIRGCSPDASSGARSSSASDGADDERWTAISAMCRQGGVGDEAGRSRPAHVARLAIDLEL